MAKQQTKRAKNNTSVSTKSSGKITTKKTIGKGAKKATTKKVSTAKKAHKTKWPA